MYTRENSSCDEVTAAEAVEKLNEFFFDVPSFSTCTHIYNISSSNIRELAVYISKKLWLHSRLFRWIPSGYGETSQPCIVH